jgi:GTPase SAR1 family protein
MHGCVSALNAVNSALRACSYDVGKASTFEHVRDWAADMALNAETKVIRAIVGNKVDLPVEAKQVWPARPALLSERGAQVDRARGEALARELDSPFFEVSAADGTSINAMFEGLVELLMQDQLAMSQRARSTVDERRLSVGEAPAGRSCCGGGGGGGSGDK